MDDNISIKRENWNGKFRVVARRKGKITVWKPYSPKKNQTVTALKRQFDKTKSFDKNVINVELANVIETTDLRKKLRKPKNRSFQGYARTKIDNKVVEARSLQRDFSYPKQMAIDEALDHLYGRIAQALGLSANSGDVDSGIKAIEDKKLNIETGIIFYTQR